MTIECPNCKRTFDTNEALEQHKKSKHSEANPGNKINKNYIIAGVVLVVIVLAIAAALSVAPNPYSIKTLDTDNYIGNDSAKVTLIEFSDFQCPYCGNFYNSAEQQIKDAYVDTEKIKFIYKNFPLSIHENAQKAAEAAECAKDIGGQEAFWKMHNKLFENNKALSVNNLKKYASDLGLNSTEFNSCLDSSAMTDRVASDLADGKSSGVQGTPAFFINGQKIEGSQPFSVFQKAIDSALSKV